MWMVKISTTIVIAYALLCLAVYLMQRQMLYHPGRGAPAENLVHAAGFSLWPAPGEAFRGYVDSTPTLPGSGVVVMFHGNAGIAWDRLYYATPLRKLGCRVVLAEYPGYGGRPGRPGETAIVADAREIVRRAGRDYGEPVYVCGESLGAGVAAAVAKNPPGPIAGVILITPWDTLADAASSIYWFLPVRLLLRETYDHVGNLAGFGGRVAVAVAEHDEIIPKRHGIRLYDSLPTPDKRLWIIQGAGHNTWPSRVGESWWREVMGFFDPRNPLLNP